MALSFLQANVNHSARAQDLLVQTMAEWEINVAVVAEPYAVPTRDDWMGDRDGLVAIAAPASGGSPPLEKVAKGRGSVLAVLGGVAVIGVYFPPSWSLADFEQALGDVGALVGRAAPNPVLVAGDFNAHSRVWGSPATDARGRELEDWAVSMGLVVLNRGSVSTCVRLQGRSIVDITFAMPALARRIQGWRVVAGVETLSDHRYIRFVVSSLPATQERGVRSPAGESPRWVLGRLDREMAKEAAMVESWVAGSHQVADIDVEAERLGVALTRVCDASMPRAKPFAPRRWVYWWRADFRELRKACVRARRRYARCRRRRVRDSATEDALYLAYRAACKTLQTAIARAKQAAWEEWLATLDCDPWGRPYRAVRQKLRPWAPPLTTSLEPRLVERVVSTLFPAQGEFVLPPMAPAVFQDVEEEARPVVEAELRAAALKLRLKRTAPGLDGVPGRVLALALLELGNQVENFFTQCLIQGRFPSSWKTGKLVLLRKDGRPPDQPSAYRPVVLLGEMSKLFERVLAARLAEYVHLHDTQFGFRCGRSTIDAVSRVKGLAEEAVSEGDVMLAVSLDISNAFNTLPWEAVMGALQYFGVPGYLQAVIRDYFTERAVVFPTRDGWGRRAMSCGVPQGSVLGPFLWNIGYDWVLRGATLRGVGVTCYADDTLVSARGSTHRDAMVLATAGVAQVVHRIRRLGLEVALHKSEVLVFHGPRNKLPQGAHIVVGGASIAIGSTMKYLGLVLDSRWRFTEHFRRLAPKLVAAAGALGAVLPNLRGPGGTCRRLYLGIVRSMALYGSPIWAEALCAQNLALLRRAQRVMAQRVARAYRTVSYTAGCLLAGSPPWDLEAEVLAAVYWRRVEARQNELLLHPLEIAQWREEARDVLLQKWAERLEAPSASRELAAAIRPTLKEWVECRHNTPSYHLTQMLTGHGCFGAYLFGVVGREPTADCHHCGGGAVDTAEHTRAECPAWAVPRAAVSAVVGGDLSLPALVNSMVGSEEAWKAVLAFCETVLLAKETAEWEREDSVGSLPIRRRRPGRRRLAYLATSNRAPT